jgi:predicted HicB family RNase H-like nuclease
VELFPTPQQWAAFSGSVADKEIAQILEKLPDPPSKPLVRDASGKLQVRMPKSLHSALISEAADEGVSLNQLIVSKLAVQLKAATAN